MTIAVNKSSGTKQWLRTKVTTNNINKPHIILVTDNHKTKITGHNLYKIIAKNLKDAETQISFLDSSLLDMAEGAIVIDMQGCLQDLENLLAAIRQKNSCLILINKNILDENQIKFLKSFDLIDDAIDLETGEFTSAITTRYKRKSKSFRSTISRQKRAFAAVRKADIRNSCFYFKTVFDCCLAAIAILLLSPLILLIAIAIKLDSRGPVFYSSLRAGRGYRIFKFYKFRSMVSDADKKMQNLAHLNQYDSNSTGPQFFKLNNDPRVTRVGKFLRNTSLDELPQLFNVLIGDMQIVGNRPLPLYEAETLTTNDFVERFSAPAGITGYWQIKKRGKAEMSVKERMALDIYYSRKASPLLDLYIIANTPAALFQQSDV